MERTNRRILPDSSDSTLTHALKIRCWRANRDVRQHQIIKALVRVRGVSDKQTDRRTDRDKDRQRNGQTDRKTETRTDRQSDRGQPNMHLYLITNVVREWGLSAAINTTFRR